MLIVIKVWYNFYMKYEKIMKAQFMARPNRFIAEVKLADGTETRAHVKNTGRCRELLQPGATVWLEDHTERMGSRKLAYSLIGVEKLLKSGSVLMVNMDSQAPNRVAEEALREGRLTIPGMGRLSWDALVGRDYAVFLALLALTASFQLIGNLISDMLYMIIDPRVDFSKKG